ncbi:alpha/beta fold hydrolase [Ectothiorhodospiraceae bacterium WFHF3C12]|nr:alpha/beta fold hydrolase [Ectothiorhodospiraceae bacterium WFHF3C12]
MPYASNGETRLYYEAHGDGPPLALVMGLGGSIQAWGMQIPKLSQRYRVIAMDNRGAGRSDKPDVPYSIAGMAGDLACVLDAAGVDSAHVMGASMGGFIAQAFYHAYPGRTRSLILACTGASLYDPEGEPPDQTAMEIITRDRHGSTLRENMAAVAEVFYHPAFRRRVPDLVDRLTRFEEQLPQPPHAYHRQLEAVRAFDPAPDFQRGILAPTLVLHGADDRAWPPGNARLLARRIPGAELVILDNAAHMLMVERPQAFNDAVMDFLDRHRENNAGATGEYGRRHEREG